MALRYTAYAQDLWRVAAGAFNAVIAAGLPAVNIAFVNQVRVKSAAVMRQAHGYHVRQVSPLGIVSVILSFARGYSQAHLCGAQQAVSIHNFMSTVLS